MYQEANGFGLKFVGCVILRYVPYNMTVFWKIYETCTSLDNNCCWNYNWTENVGHKLYTDKISAQLFDDLHAETVNCCGTVRANTRVVLRVFDRNETSR